MIKIGTNPVGWTNDLLHTLGDNISLETCLADAAAAGYAGIELGRKFPRSASSLRPLLERAGIDLVSGWHSLYLIEDDPHQALIKARAHIDLLNAMGCSIMIVAECTRQVDPDYDAPLSSRPQLTEEQFAKFNDRLSSFAELVRAEGLGLAYHHHMGTVIQSFDDIRGMMTGTSSSVKLLLDTGHAVWAGADPQALAQLYRDRISHIHVKDVRGAVVRAAVANDWSFLKGVVNGAFTVPGDGDIDFVSVLSQLPDYEGWIVVEAEQDPERAAPAKYAAMGFQNIERFLMQSAIGAKDDIAR